MQAKDKIKEWIARLRKSRCPEGYDADSCDRTTTCSECWSIFILSQPGIYVKDENKLATPPGQEVASFDEYLIPTSSIVKKIQEVRNVR